MGSPTHNPELPGLLPTKLYRPPATPDLEQRARLTQRLDHNRQRPLTLISAPAGYGKTMLASMWLASCDCPSGWVSLDEVDNDLRTFTSYLLAAVRTAFPGLELKTQALLDAPTLPPVPVLARYLLNDLDQIVEPFVLALHDVHLIHEQAIHELLSELLRHPPPCVHLVLIGRRDPNLNIASMRAGSQVTEIRVWDLRFTPQETARLLGQWLDRDIDAAIAAEWTHKTEGWMTTLRLAALSLRHRDRTDDLGVDFQGDSRYLHSYLLAEVLARLPVAQQAWLLMIAVLDRFCAPLCEAVCQADARMDLDCLSGVEFIDWLQRENLFLVPLDDRGEWFRFHHLFQRLLQDQLKRERGPGDIAGLHERASRWLAENDLVEEALQHALAAGDVKFAVHLVEGHRYHLMNTDQWRRLRRWLDLLPPEAVAARPCPENPLRHPHPHRRPVLYLLRHHQPVQPHLSLWKQALQGLN